MKVLGKMENAQDAVSKEYVDGLVEQGGGGEIDTSMLATKEELTNLTNEMVANEEVHAAAYSDLDSRLKDIGSLISGVAVTKEEFQEGLQSITDEIVSNEEVHAAALTDLDSRLRDIGSLISGVAVTKEEFQEGLNSVREEVASNEEVWAAALTDINNRIAALEAKIK